MLERSDCYKPSYCYFHPANMHPTPTWCVLSGYLIVGLYHGQIVINSNYKSLVRSDIIQQQFIAIKRSLSQPKSKISIQLNVTISSLLTNQHSLLREPRVVQERSISYEGRQSTCTQSISGARLVKEDQFQECLSWFSSFLGPNRQVLPLSRVFC